MSNEPNWSLIGVIEYVPVAADRSLKSDSMFANASILLPTTSHSMSSSTSCSSSTYVDKSRSTEPESSLTVMSSRAAVISGHALKISKVNDLLVSIATLVSVAQSKSQVCLVSAGVLTITW